MTESVHDRTENHNLPYQLSFNLPDPKTLQVRPTGDWKRGATLPTITAVLRQLELNTGVHAVHFDSRDLHHWDSALLTFLLELRTHCGRTNIAFVQDGLPQGVQRLLALALAVPERKGTRREAKHVPFFAKVGTTTVELLRSLKELLAFLGETSLAFWQLLRGRSRLRRADLLLIMQDCGARSLPIVTLLSMLVGLIFAFVGAVQLTAFGAQIYVASLVGIAMVRIVGALMAGIIMAGRTGAAFAAELGTMQVNEEIDALQTLGISPIDSLVLPRVLALTLMMPLLCVYADLMGIIGGMLVGVGMLQLNVTQYFNMTKDTVRLSYLWIGLFHSLVFGVLIALAGCLKGIRCGRSASAVGDAVTSAVVTSIVCIVIATAIITLICNVLGI